MKGTCSNLTRRICSEAGNVCGWCELGTAMEICGKCGKAVNHRLHGMCMACRYEEKKAKPGKIQEKACRECGALFQAKRSTQAFCSPKCRRKHGDRLEIERAGTNVEATPCVTCGKFFRLKRTGRYDAKCPECLEKEANRPPAPPHIETPTRTCYLKPGGWTGPIEKEPDKPARAKMRIPANRLPVPPHPLTRPLHLKPEKPQIAYEYEITPEAQEARKPKKHVPVKYSMRRRKAADKEKLP